jgi:hypothetical protein
MGKGRRAGCHAPETSFMDNQMHDLKLERFYRTGASTNGLVMLPDGPIKTFTLAASRIRRLICMMVGC